VTELARSRRLPQPEDTSPPDRTEERVSVVDFLTLKDKTMTKSTYIVVITVLLFSSACHHGQRAKQQAPDKATPSSAALDPSYSAIKAKAEATVDALTRKDYDLVTDYTYPGVIELMGGREETISVFEDELGKIERKGYTIASVQVGEPTKIEIIGKQSFSIVPTTLTLRFPRGTATGESFLIAVSEDGSKTWTFVDGSIAADKETLRQIFPLAASKLRLPPQKRPVVHLNEVGGAT
jgi:hypothetical protein